MNKFDMHFHTTMSDWKLTNEEVIKEAVEKWIDFLSVTEHDIVNTDFVNLAKKKWIDSLEWVEVSSFDNIIAQRSLHITCYANKFNWKLINVLENTRNGKVGKVKKQIDVLRWNWFDIDYDKFIQYFENKWFDKQNLNNSHVSEYLYLNDENVKLVEELTWEKISWWDFIRRCLKTHWDFKHIWWTKVDKYEPTIKEIWEIAKQNWYFLSLAHPNFTFRNDFELFILFIQEYKDILNWIEINSLASKEWVEIILKTAKKYNLILTFWSDDHFIRDKVDNVHWNIWDKNPYVSETDIMENFKHFILLLNTINTLKKSYK